MPKLPGIGHGDAVRVLQKVGWRVAREGKHTILAKGDHAIPILRHNPINPFTMGNIAKGAGLDAGGISQAAVALFKAPSSQPARGRLETGPFGNSRNGHAATAARESLWGC